MQTSTLPFEYYLKLPFEVYYSGDLAFYQYEFLSDSRPKVFRDVKVVHEQTGQASPVSFLCRKNTGKELVFCILNKHDQVCPSWLETVDDESMGIEINYGTYYKITVKDGKIIFDEFTDVERDFDSEGHIDVDEMLPCCSDVMSEYGIGDTSPDYLILDSENTRIKVDLDGYILNNQNEPSEHRLFDPNELSEKYEYEDCESRELGDSRCDWVKSVLETDFPKETNLYLEKR
jgi:hypothetical protein